MSGMIASYIAISRKARSERHLSHRAKLMNPGLLWGIGEGVICPTGAPSKILSSGPAKNISLHELVETALWIPTSRLTRRGVSRSSRTRGGMRWTRQRFARDGIAGRIERSVSDHRHADERCCSVRQNRVVLTPRCWRQVLRSCVGPTGLRQNISADDGGKRARSPGSAT
jgi:hypothetical protein